MSTFSGVQSVEARHMPSLPRSHTTFFPHFRRLSAHGRTRHGDVYQTKVWFVACANSSEGKITFTRHFRGARMPRRGLSPSRGALIIKNPQRHDLAIAKLFAISIALHREDLEEVGKTIGRSAGRSETLSRTTKSGADITRARVAKDPRGEASARSSARGRREAVSCRENPRRF
jgi:hypothetical protein